MSFKIPSASFRSRAGVVAGTFLGVPLTVVLEVLGAGGAIWAGSDYLHLRKGHSAKWGVVPIFICAVAFSRYLAQFYNYKKLNLTETNQSTLDAFCHTLVSPFEITKAEFLGHPKSAMIAMVIGIPVSFFLEALAGGAIWGSSQYFNLRGDGTKDNIAWSSVAVFVTLLSLVRYGIKYYSERLDPKIKCQKRFDNFCRTLVSPHKLSKKEFFYQPKSIAIAAAFGVFIAIALEVLGAGGAIWGGSDFLYMRNKNNGSTWDDFAIAFFVFGLVRYAGKYYCEAANLQQKQKGFFDGFIHGVVYPYTAIKVGFFQHSEDEPDEETGLMERKPVVSPFDFTKLDTLADASISNDLETEREGVSARLSVNLDVYI